jgi:hypothetical protein
VIDDDDDWIPVDDDDGMEDSFLSPRAARSGGGLALNVSDAKNESYVTAVLPPCY